MISRQWAVGSARGVILTLTAEGSSEGMGYGVAAKVGEPVEPRLLWGVGTGLTPL